MCRPATWSILLGILGAAVLWGATWATGAAPRASESPAVSPPDDRDRPYREVTVRGKVVWLAEVLKARYGVTTVPEARQRVLALETADGTLHPIVEDVRGRAFRRDPRLRGIPVELMARQHHGSPMLQIVKLFAIREDGKFELDYWCEICAIAMFELKPCDCCQGPIELRTRKRD